MKWVSDLEKVLEKYLNEQFDMENASLDFSCPKLEETVKKDEKCKGSFHISSQGSSRENEGYLYASDMRIHFQNNRFQGNEVEIDYIFDATGLEEGEVLKGEIYVVSEKGEYFLPFVFIVAHTNLETSLGNIKNLFHFANLAKTNWREALQLFYSNDFAKILVGNDRQYFSVYKGLAKDFGNEQNVEEFLIDVNKKQPIEYLLDKEQLNISDPEGVVGEKIGITKNGWGYVSLYIFIEGDFLTAEKEYLTDDEFLGNFYQLNLYIYSEKLHSGINYGAIRFVYPYGEMRFPIEVTRTNQRKKSVSEQRKLNVQLMNQYMNFRMKRVNTANWISATENIIQQLIKCDDKTPVYRLFHAQILITQERYNEAKWVLDHVKDMLEDEDYPPEVICYYLYLKTLYKREETYVNKQTETIETIYSQNRGNWRIAWLLLYLREEYSRNPARKWILLEEQFHYGNCSPVLYIEATYLMNANPSLLQELGEFEIQILNFAVKKELLGIDVIPQIHYLAGRMKNFSNRLYHILEYCYEQTRDVESVQEICELLMKGNKTDHAYFKWYALGVEKQIRVTKLYEYFMLSISLDYVGELPKIVMMYFAYACNLPYERTAFLYANLLRHRDMFPEMVRSYGEQMNHFVVDQLQKNHMNRELAYLYVELISPAGMNETVANALAPLLFLHQVEVEDANIRQVVVIHDKLKGEVRYPVSNGKATIAIYSAGYQIFLQDGFGNRYRDKDRYTLIKFISPRRLIRVMEKMNLDDLGLDIYICESSSDYVTITEDNYVHFARLVDSEQVRMEYKREIRVKLAEYYFEHDMIRELDEYLQRASLDGMDERERAEFIQYMVNRGMYDRAMEWIRACGAEDIPGKVLFRLCSRLLERNEFYYDEYLLQLCHVSFVSKKYDENVLQYLVNHYKGNTKELRDIWKAAVNFGLDVRVLSERIIIQMLYSCSFIPEGIEIFMHYVETGADSEIKLAFLAHCAYEYFADDKVMNTNVFRYLTDMMQNGVEVSRVCKFAYLKHFAENKDQLDEGTGILVKQIIREMIGLQLYLSFYMEFIDLVPELSMMQDRVMLEYKSNSRCKVCLHYVFSREGEEQSSEYRKEELRGIYGRVFLKGFVLFFGENIQYYITEEIGGHEKLTESGTIQNTVMSEDAGDSKFMIINDIATAKTLQDYDTVEQLFQELYKKEYMVENLFRIR
ncbi:MAG: DUF5717 family protein [Lachnospiraceae bacterium]|nr:DUF5717 family protein [Lachnospiraceae bacterium]